MPARRFRSILAALACGLAACSAAHAQVTRLGALGDSLTDEYSEESYSYARSWTQQLVLFRGVNMGPTAAAVGQPGGTWGEPRRAGYASNWARYGADSADLLTQGQHTGVAAQASSAGVSHAVLAIGTNDYSPTVSVYFNIYWGFWSSSQITSYADARAANVEQAAAALRAAGIGVVIGNAVDFGVAPAPRGIYTSASRRQRVSDAVSGFNSRFEGIARRQRAVLLDLNALGSAILGTNQNLRSTLTIGGVTVQLFQRDTSTNTNPLAGFVDDGAHPHTTLQGVFASAVMTALNTGFNAGLAPFTEQEILAHAGLTYVGPDSLEAQIGPMSRFVRDFTCLANFNGVDGRTPQDIFDFLTAYFAGSPFVDVTNDGVRSPADIFAFLTAYFAGC
jgi:hypothetical protein